MAEKYSYACYAEIIPFVVEMDSSYQSVATALNQAGILVVFFLKYIKYS